MDWLFERFSATELDNILHAVGKYEQGEGFSAEEIQTSIWLDGKIAPPIEDAMQAIVKFNKELITIAKTGKMGKRFKPGPHFNVFLNSGGFKGLFEKEIVKENSSTQERSLAQQANLATIDAAAFAKRSADASEVSAGAAERSADAAGRCAQLAKQAIIISIIAALLSLATLVKSFFD